MNNFKSICKNCHKIPYYSAGPYTNHWWTGECLTLSTGSYVPSDNLEYLEYLYNKKVKANG